MYQKEIIVQDSLWQSFVNGSREAYARLYELYVRPMYLYGLHFCAVSYTHLTLPTNSLV